MKFAGILALAASALFATCTVASAQALSKTWVSSTGSDTGACSITAPCGSFQYAYSQTAAGGEIEVKDSGQYGNLTINHAVSVISSNATGTIGLNPNSTAILVNAGSNDIVTLRGLVLNGHGSSATVGINIQSGKTVIVDSCIIEGMGEGIYVNAPSTTGMITNNLLTQNQSGIYLYGNTNIYLSGNRIAGNSVGIRGNNNNPIYTYGDNLINTNSTSDEFSVTTNSAAKY